MTSNQLSASQPSERAKRATCLRCVSNANGLNSRAPLRRRADGTCNYARAHRRRATCLRCVSNANGLCTRARVSDARALRASQRRPARAEGSPVKARAGDRDHPVASCLANQQPAISPSNQQPAACRLGPGRRPRGVGRPRVEPAHCIPILQVRRTCRAKQIRPSLKQSLK